MAYSFDHAIIAVRDLDEAISLYSNLGFNVELGGRHTGQGTHNAIVRFQASYLELLSVYSESEASSKPRPRMLVEYLRAHSGGLVGYVLSTDDIEGNAARWRTAGIDFDGPSDSERLTPDGRRLAFTTLRSAGRPYPSCLPVLVHAHNPAAGTPRLHSNSVTAVASISIVVSDLKAAADQYRQYLAVLPSESGNAPELAAKWIRVKLGDFSIDLLSPYDEGPVRRVLNDVGESPFQLTLAVADTDQVTTPLRFDGADGGVLVKDVLGVRMRIFNDRSNWQGLPGQSAES